MLDKNRINWDIEQENMGIPIIERTYKVRLPNGKETEVNRFYMNLTMSTRPESWVQCKNGGWISADRLTIIDLTSKKEVPC